MLRKSVLLSAVMASMVNAECSKDVTVMTSDDSALKCSTFSGDLTIDPSFNGILNIGIGQIKGKLAIVGADNITSISAPGLNAVSGVFQLNGLTRLTQASFPALTTVGSINFDALPQITDFTAKISSAQDIHISNTDLPSLSGIDLTSATNFIIVNNQYLKTLNVKLQNVTNAIMVEFNARGLNASFPELTSANNLTFGSTGSVSLPKLQKVDGAMLFTNNTFTSFSAPALKTVGQTLSMANDTELTSVSFPQLTTVGGALFFAGNPNLKIVDGFPKLDTIKGAFDFSGNFTNITIPKITDIRGKFNLQTSSEFDCTPFQSLKDSGVIKGDNFTCVPKTAQPESTTNSDGTSTSSGSSASGSGTAKKNTAITLSMNPLSAIAALAFMASWLL